MRLETKFRTIRTDEQAQESTSQGNFGLLETPPAAKRRTPDPWILSFATDGVSTLNTGSSRIRVAGTGTTATSKNAARNASSPSNVELARRTMAARHSADFSDNADWPLCSLASAKLSGQCKSWVIYYLT